MAEEGRRGRNPLKPKETTPVPSKFYLFFLGKHSQVLLFFFFFNPHHTVFGFVSLSLSPPFIVSVCGLKGSYLCKGINWARMRLNHKCKVASATARLYSLVAYQAIDALPSIYAVPVWRFTSPRSASNTHKNTQGRSRLLSESEHHNPPDSQSWN